MDPADLAVSLVNAMTWAMATFLVAAGLTLIFGILHILNFAHGGFFMIGAYVAFSALGRFGGTPTLPTYLVAGIVGAIAVGALGWVVDKFVLRRLRQVEDAYVLIATYALLLVCEGGTKLIWGLGYQSVMPPAPLDGAWVAGRFAVPTFSLFVIAAGVVVFALVEWLLAYTSAGRLIRAVAMDPWTSRLLGVNVTLVFAMTVVFGCALAGLSGGLLLANQSLSPELASVFIIQAFGVIIVGGMGSVRGAFIGAMLLGLIESIGSYVLPELPGVLFFAAMAAVLLIRPQGLMGRERVT